MMVTLDTIEVVDNVMPKLVYRESRPRINDILHIRLEASFDWENAYLIGNATLTCKPHFYPVKTLVLDAKGFEIKKVALQIDDNLRDLVYAYDSTQLSITLDKEYNRTEQYTIVIDYIAKPEELEQASTEVSSSDKGLYFINRDNSDSTKPRQIWTQGETQSTSCWLPTIDAPNEKMTQEMFITVDTGMVTLSNGEFIYSAFNKDGTRTDHWHQKYPHSPYLFMMAVGDFAVVKDKWRDIEVNYYVEPKYEKYAMQIFGKTPRMMEYFSNILGVDYPWDKYSQIAVEDFVSGAMENTSATVHFGGLQQTSREMIDGDYEEYIAHELFHQWFGDLVTCESWSNLPLNESFATYGEYLWKVYEYGSDEAAYHIHTDLQRYLSEARKKQVPLVRFKYEEQDDMFDRHSYQKGCRVLHMLHNYLGDDAFFESLKLYLTRHKYKNTEIHDLRLAFEEISGEDLNWFFTQWFLSSGHPELEIEYQYDDSLKLLHVIIEQTQDSLTTPVFRIPLSIDLYYDGKVDRKEELLRKSSSRFVYPLPMAPDLVNVDGDKILLCTKRDNKPTEAFIFQYHHAPLFLDRYEAVVHCRKQQDESVAARTLIFEALDDTFYVIRKQAVHNITLDDSATRDLIKVKLIEMALNDKKSSVRAAAVTKLAKFNADDSLLSTFEALMQDSSYLVESKSLKAIYEIDSERALSVAREIDNTEGQSVLLQIADIYSEVGTDQDYPFFEHSFNVFSGYSRYGLMKLYGNYLTRLEDSTLTNKGITNIKDFALNENEWWVRYAALSGIEDIRENYKEEYELIRIKLDQVEADTDEYLTYKQKMDDLDNRMQNLDNIIDYVKEQETNDELLKIYNRP